MTTFGDACSGVTEDAHISTPMPPFLRVHGVISGSCLGAEINYVLNYVHELDAFPGTDGLRAESLAHRREIGMSE